MSIWLPMAAPKAPVLLRSTLRLMLRMPSPNLMATTGKVASSKFVKTVLLVAVDLVVSALAEDLVQASVEATAVDTELEAGLVEVSRRAVAMEAALAADAVATEAACMVVVAAAMAEVAPHLKRPPQLRPTHSRTSLLLEPSRDLLSMSAT